MKARIYYSIGEYDDSVIIEGETLDELREQCKYEIDRRGAIYTGSEILEDSNE